MLRCRLISLIVLAAVVPGCTLIDSVKTEHRMKCYARKAWDRVESCYDDSPYEAELKEGFQEGYLHFVYQGSAQGGNCLPDKFNRPRYQTCFGKEGIAAYQRGYQLGLKSAAQDCSQGAKVSGCGGAPKAGCAAGNCQSGCATGGCATGGIGQCATCAAPHATGQHASPAGPSCNCATQPSYVPDQGWHAAPYGGESWMMQPGMMQPYEEGPYPQGQPGLPVPPEPNLPPQVPTEQAPLPSPVPDKATSTPLPSGPANAAAVRSFGARVVGPGQLLPATDGVVDLNAGPGFDSGQTLELSLPEAAVPAPSQPQYTPPQPTFANPEGWRPSRPSAAEQYPFPEAGLDRETR